jgi:hypothetical protein
MGRDPVVCPCCPLHCDDIDPDQLMLGKTGCAVADHRISVVLAAAARSDEESRRDEAACAMGRQWIADANRIVVTGRVIDLETSRAISEFANATGADVEVDGSNPAMLPLFAREGAFLTTLGEIASRDVSMLVIGDVASHWPRIETWLERVKVIRRWNDDETLASRLAALRKTVSQRASATIAIDDEVAFAANMIKASSYVAVLVAPLSDNVARSSVIWSTLLCMVRELNKATRAAVLSFDHSLTVRSVMASRLDPKPYRLPSDHDALHIHFSPFGDESRRSGGKSIVIGIGDKVFNKNQLCLTASVPGLDRSGIVIRGDGAVTLPLQNCLQRLESRTSLPTPAYQLRRLFASA